MRIAVLQVASPDDESPGERRARVLARLDDVADSHLVVLPELWLTGYFNFDRYAVEAETIDGPTVGALARTAKDLDLHLVGGSIVERSDSGLANCAFLLGPSGDVLGSYRKIHLFSYGSDEAQLLTPGTDAAPASTPLGRVAMTTCYDLRFPELYRAIADRGVDIICVPAAWPMARLDHWRVLLRARAIENQAFVIACNGAGEQRDTKLAGHSMIVDPWGNIVAEAGVDEEVLWADIDVSAVARIREDFPVLTHRRILVGQPPSVAG